MKRILWILCAALTLAACGGKDPVTPEDSLSVSPTSLSFLEEDGSVKLVSVTASGAWTASASAGWIHVSPSSGSRNGSLSVTVDASTAGGTRTGSINLSCGSKSASVSVTQSGTDRVEIVPAPAAFDGNKRASTTYQLLIYTFADSDGDGVGDFRGIQNKLDYLDGLGITALWLSPAHPTSSYHAYDVDDYYTLNPLYAVGEKTSAKAEQDFQELLEAAHAKGIKIYMDYVLNHSGKHNAWFQEALADPASPYRDYYFFSANPSADYSSFPMLVGTTYQSGEWKTVTSGSPKLKITSTTDAVTSGTESWNLYMWKDGSGDKTVKFVSNGDGTYYAVTEINGKWGVLLRKYNNWDAGSKFGAMAGSGTITEGQEVELVADGGDMWFTGNGRYKVELSNVSTETLFYMGCFSDWMPDLNYGDVSVAETNACFQALAASADKWIEMGIDGLRLDAVKHICGGINSFNHASNRTLLAKWYDVCNAAYKAAGHSDNIFMVAEEWDSHDTEKNYYKALTSCFEFDYGYKVRDILNSQNASGFATQVAAYVSDHTALRADAITSFFLSNHDQDRFGSNVNTNVAREKQAGAILLSGPGKPFVYQGEELGYWGKKDSGDENVRQPIAWDAALQDLCKRGLTMGQSDKVNYDIVKGSISVETQSADATSILNVYKTWSRLRNTYPALATGEMTPVSLSGTSIAAWYMTAGNQKLLVIHNVAGSEKQVSVSDNMSKPVALLGTGFVKEQTLILGANSSVVFQL